MWLTLMLFVVGLGLAFGLGFMVGRQRSIPQPTLPEATPLVNFEFKIPADTAPGDQLYLTGSFNQWRPNDPTYVLSRSADIAYGAWPFTHGLQLEFKLTRGSWQNVEKALDGSEIPNRRGIAASGAQVKGSVAAWADRQRDPAKIYDERVERVDLFSNALGITRTFYIYVPLEARSDENLRVPSLYLFRGHEREWINKNEDGTRGGNRNVLDVYEELRCQNRIGPMVLVFPGMTNANDAVHSLGINLHAPELAADPTLGSGRFEDFIYRDLIPYVETHYPVLFGGAHRSLDGFSLGGFISVNQALRHPNEWASVGAYDGLFFWDDPENAEIIAARDSVFERSLFDANFGVPRDHTFAAQHNPLTLLRIDGAQASKLQWLIEYGPESAEPNVNYYRGARLDELLREVGAHNRLSGVVPNANHSWQMADEHMRRSLPYHYQQTQ
ncbi:alpha/beta hydrolase [Herpetosiphon geysericola]|uniref:alpha/beta hydrolase n=1 Tax=Herpetosiphon geysericola TaxID=70996 RepID=UPI0006C904AF|nr:alpha/beta hydrolase-fold protein [Herpetosiphon geysericola]